MTEKTKTRTLRRFWPLYAVVALVTAAVLGVGAVAQANATAGQTDSIVQADGTHRIVDVPGIALAPGASVDVAVAGKASVPANADMAFVDLSSYLPAGPGTLVVHPKGTGAPGTPTVAFGKGGEVTNLDLVGLTDGAVTVTNTGKAATRFLMTAKAAGTAMAVPPAPVQRTFAATTALTNRQDSGVHGNWAVDNGSRVATLTVHGAAPAFNCGNRPNCRFVTYTVADTMTFNTLPNANSPEAGTAISGTLSGSVVGGETGEFYTTGTPDPTLVPASVSGNAVSTSTWLKQFFPAADYVSAQNEIDWGWAYTVTAATTAAGNTCEQWVNAKAGDTGDIAGVNHCNG